MCVLQVSGVLAVVTMGVLLAATFWPLVCSRTTMQNVWHTFEWLFNTVLFQLAGLIIGGALIPHWEDAAVSGSGSGSGALDSGSSGSSNGTASDGSARALAMIASESGRLLSAAGSDQLSLLR